MEAVELRDLVCRCQKGDDQAQAHFYSVFSEFAKRAVAKRIAQLTDAIPYRSDVEDICNEVFAKVFRDNCRLLRQLRKPEALHAWLMTIAQNMAVDHLRKSSTRERVHDSAAREELNEPRHTPAEKAMAGETAAVLRRGLARLPDLDRLVLELYYLQGLTYAQIAEMTGQNINTASARLRRAKAKLRRLLEKDRDELAYP